MNDPPNFDTATSPVAISSEALGLSFGSEPVLRDVTVEIPTGRFVGIIGPSGCGKTSLLRMVAGLESPTTGTLTVLEDNRRSSPRLSFVFQDPHLLPWRNVVENVRLPLELAHVAPGSARDVVDQVVHMVGLRDEDRAKYPHMLSGGMRMRVSLARALVNRPELLLFDEPFAALDDLLRQRLNEDLLRLWQEKRWTVLFVTHNVNEAAYLSQEVLVMSQRPGTIRAQVPIPFPYPRGPELRASGEFARLTGQLSSILRGVADESG